MSPLLSAALDEARWLAAERAWVEPAAATLFEAERLLVLTAGAGPAPGVLVEPNGAISLEWEAADGDWLSLTVQGLGTVEHSGVIDGDDYGQVEDFNADLPDWAGELLHRLLGPLH